MHAGDDLEDASSSTTSNLYSRVWQYFTIITLEPDGVKRAACNSCNKVLKVHGTSNIRRHILSCFKADLSNKADWDAPPPKRICLDQAKYKEKLAISIIKHNYSFNYVEHEGTRDLHKFLHPDAKPISRNNVKKVVLNINEREKLKVKEELEKIKGRVCLTSDLWTSITSDGYMTLTAHYIDETLVLRKKVLNFRVIPPPHTGSLLAESVISFLREWGIEKNTITLDNAMNNNGLVDCLKDQLSINDALLCEGEFIHVRCCAHVINLNVQSGLKVIEEAIEKVRESVKYVRGSAARKIKFAECIAQLKLQCGKNVRQDVVTRWNYTYLMLDCALVYRRAYALLKSVDTNFKTCPTPEEWTRIEEFAKFFRPFSDITKLFSGTLYSTSNLYFHNVYKIQKVIQRHLWNRDNIISGMAKEMKTKFDKYWESYSMVLSFGAILDPRYKLNIVEFYLLKLGMEGQDLIDKVASVEQGLRKLYSAYEIRANVMHDLTEGPSSRGANSCV